MNTENTSTKPKCKLIDENGNVFAMASRVSQALKGAGLRDQATEFRMKLWDCQSYDEALALMTEYVEVE